MPAKEVGINSLFLSNPAIWNWWSTFVASRKGNEFCSQKCKNQFNVYKSREKKKGNR